MTQIQPPTLAILAGGAGARMGAPKTLLQIDDQPILNFLHQRFSWPGPTLLVTSPAHHHPPGCEKFDREAIDKVANQGPLRGLLTALHACSTEWLLALTVDMPQIGPPQLQWLTSQTTQIDPTIHGLMLQAENRLEPFPSLWRNDLASAIESLLANGERSMRHLATLQQVHTTKAPTDWPPDIWTNLNNPKDLAEWKNHHQD